ncbi:unnamed protein product [Litomosoides sigmodontis]|uniref:Uncharacterized protein n=1 Tax=Litomosoides sigmodontis TaxID=42156 RepID=A0A3P6TLW5_LITSI|nr:unnamed protein product [Litomosoides sigmodontis]
MTSSVVSCSLHSQRQAGHHINTQTDQPLSVNLIYQDCTRCLVVHWGRAIAPTADGKYYNNGGGDGGMFGPVSSSAPTIQLTSLHLGHYHWTLTVKRKVLAHSSTLQPPI